jgi:hypothetical protein
MKNQLKVLVKTAIILVITLFVMPAVVDSQDTGDTQPKIIEEVNVTHVEVPVRVFRKGVPVTGLKKENFKIFVDGKEKPIQGFYQSEKDIKAPKMQHALPEPRLFVLIFNICDYRLDMEKALDTFFDLILKPNDRLIVVTRKYFLEDMIVANPADEKKKVKKILEMESRQLETKQRQLEVQLKSMLRSHLDRADRYGAFKKSSAKDFVNNYMVMVQEFKGLYLDMSTEKYARLAQYLAGQSVDKWVLNFYQIGRFFKPKYGSELFKSIVNVDPDSEILFDSMDSFRVFDQLQDIMTPDNTLPQKDLVKLFTGTGATFHTLLMEGHESVINEFASEIQYVSIVSESFDLLKKLTFKTGGRFSKPNQVDSFYNYLLSSEDIHYVLTYVPDKRSRRKSKTLKVTVDNKNYQVFFDDQKRGGYFRKIMKKHRISKAQPRIRIERVDYADKVLSFVVSNFKIHEPPTAGEQVVKEQPIKLQVRLQIFSGEAKSLFDGVKMFYVTREQLSGNQARVRLQISFPKIPAGSYDVYIWVGDSGTGKRDLAIKEVQVAEGND